MADLFIGLGALIIGILMIIAGVKGMKRNKELHRNPDGLTRDEFIERNADIHNLAEICWYFGIQPDELKEEIEILMSKRKRYK